MTITSAKTGLGEPVAIVSAIQAVLVLLVSFGKLGALGLHTQGDVALVVGVLAAGGGVYLAWSTHQTLLAPIVQLVQAGVALGAIYGLHLTTEQTGLVIATVTAVFGAFHRTQTTPLTRGNFQLTA